MTRRSLGIPLVASTLALALGAACGSSDCDDDLCFSGEGGTAGAAGAAGEGGASPGTGGVSGGSTGTGGMASGGTPGEAGAAVAQLVCCNGKVFFRADDGVHGAELWVSDGTAAGTQMVRELRSGEVGANPDYLACLGTKVYFSANDGTAGIELWASDGTAAGTAMVTEIRAGRLPTVRPDHPSVRGMQLLPAEVPHYQVAVTVEDRASASGQAGQRVKWATPYVVNSARGHVLPGPEGSKVLGEGTLLISSKRLFLRAFEIWQAQIVVTCVALALLGAGAIALQDPLLLEWHNAGPAFADTVRALVGMVLLTYQIGYFNILPLYVVLLGLFTMGVSWLVSSLNVFLRDTAQVLTIALTFWFWFTPIFFTRERLPSQLQFVADLNPLAAVVSAYRSCLLEARWPSGADLARLAIFSLTAFLVGGLFFRHTKRAFGDVL